MIENFDDFVKSPSAALRFIFSHSLADTSVSSGRRPSCRLIDDFLRVRQNFILEKKRAKGYMEPFYNTVLI